MILPAPLALPLQSPRDLGVVRAFVRAARTGLDPDVVLPPYAEPGEQPVAPKYLNDPDDVRRFRHVHYEYNKAGVYVDIDTGRISGYFEDAPPPGGGGINESDGSLPPRRVSDAQAVALAGRFYTAAGWPGGISAIEQDWNGRIGMTRDGVGSGASLGVSYVPTAGGVPYARMFGGYLELHRQTGQLTAFYGADRTLPSPPAVFTPAGSLTEARTIALRAGVALRGTSLAESPGVPMRLCIWRVRMYQNENPVMLAKRYPPRTIESLKANRGLLVYKGWLLGDRWQDAVDATIDALTGEVLALEPVPELMPGMSGGADGGGAHAPVPVPTGYRAWRVSTGAKGWKAWTAPARAGLVPLPTPVPKGPKLVLTQGNAAFPAVYDARANLLGIGGKAYRPGPALTSLLRKRAKD